jgi:hypothetical protein
MTIITEVGNPASGLVGVRQVRENEDFCPQGEAMANDNEPSIRREIEIGYLRKIGEDAASQPKDPQAAAAGSLIGLVIVVGLLFYCLIFPPKPKPTLLDNDTPAATASPNPGSK